MTHWIFKFWRSAWYLHFSDSRQFPIGFTKENDSHVKSTIFSDLINSDPQICTSPWYLPTCATCSNRSRSCPKSPIPGIFDTVVWADRAGMFRNGQNVTKRQFFVESIDFGTPIWTCTWYLRSCVTCSNRLWSCLRYQFVVYFILWLEWIVPEWWEMTRTSQN